MKKQITKYILTFILIMGTLCTANAEEYEYDDLDRVVKVIYEDGSYIEYEYDNNGNITNIVTHIKETTKDNKETTSKKEKKTPPQKIRW